MKNKLNNIIIQKELGDLDIIEFGIIDGRNWVKIVKYVTKDSIIVAFRVWFERFRSCYWSKSWIKGM